MNAVRKLGPALAGLLACLAGAVAHAHALGASYLSLATDGRAVSGDWEISIADLHAVMNLDTNASATVTAEDMNRERTRIADHALARLSVSRGNTACRMNAVDQLINERADGFYVVLRLAGECPTKGLLAIDYRLLFDVDRSHRAVVKVDDSGVISSFVLAPDGARWKATSTWSSFSSFVSEGVHHIWIGYDHIAFLMLLLLPAALRANGDSWQRAGSFREIALRTVAIITAFTLAHCVTLSLSTLGIVMPPERPIEIAIAASVVLAGFANLVPRLSGYSIWIAFGFGLVHGFGFANVLRDLGLQGNALGWSLAGFNLGVELGQLAIVVVLLPGLYVARTAAFYRLRFVPAASLATSVVALGWLLERAS